eukprot:g836.t1
MRSSLLFSICVLFIGASEGKDVLFTFTGGSYEGYETWRWDKMTHLGFWTAPGDDVRAIAQKNDVKLFQDAGVPDRKTWANATAREEYANQKANQVTQNRLDGVFFDFEGTALSSKEKEGYTALAKAVSDKLRPLNASIMICVGGRPSYEFRDYDYSGLAEASDFLFIMGYDMHFWDDYSCVTKGTCSPAEAPIKDLKLGIEEYLAKVSPEKLVLGLPWYGQRYTDIVVPWNEGQIDYKDVLAAFDAGIVEEQHFDQDSQSWRIKCKGGCLSGKGGNIVWYDDGETLAKKYALAGENSLGGVGMWKADDLPVPGPDGTDPHAANRTAMWNAIVSWNDDASRRIPTESAATIYLTSNTFPSKSAPARLSKSSVTFNVTSPDDSIATLSFDPKKGRRQTLLGFGGAITDAVAHVFNEMSAKRQEEAAEALWGESGQRYNLVRMTIGSTDFSTGIYNYNENDGNLNQSMFSLDHDKKQIIPLAKTALSKNPSLEILSSPWSPPGWMKKGWLTRKGYMRNSAKPGMIQSDEMFESYALYISKYIAEMKSEGLNVTRITIQNEPDSADHQFLASYPCCNFNGTGEGEFLRDHLGPRIRKDHEDVKIYIHDGQKYHDVPIKTRVDAILAALGGLESGFVDGVAFHWYGNNLQNYQYLAELAAAYPNLPLLATEATLQDPRTQLDPWGEAQKYAIDIIGDLNNGAEGWIEWNVLLESDGGPTCIGPTETKVCTPEIGHCDAPLLYKKSSDEIEYRGTYHFMAHFSRFISRGDVAVNGTVTLPKGSKGDTPLQCTAAVSPDGTSMTVVVLNTDKKETLQYYLDVGIDGLALVSVPPRSIQTIQIKL